jgi:hypothetical protein
LIYRWIVFKFLQEFSDANFLVVAMESLLGKDDVCSSQTRITAKKGVTFDAIIGSRSNFFKSFRMPISLKELYEEVCSCQTRITAKNSRNF